MVLSWRTAIGAACVAAVVVVVVGGAGRADAQSSRVRSSPASIRRVRRARVGGDRVHVTNLTPAGAEPHDLELNPDQIDEVLDADIVFDLGDGFQPTVEKAAEQRDGPTVSLLRAGTKDPHVWLDPVRMEGVVRSVQRELTQVDPKGRAVYARNAARLLADLGALDQRYARGSPTVRARCWWRATRPSGTWRPGTGSARREWPGSRPMPSRTPSASGSSPTW